MVNRIFATAVAAALAPAFIAAQSAGAGTTQAAPAAPVITSTGPHVYVSGSATNFVGTPGQFTLSDPGSTVTGYFYGLYGSTPDVFVPAAADGTAALAITPEDLEGLILNVQATDGTNLSPVSSFDIENSLPAGNVATLAWWRLNGAGTLSAADSTGHGHTASLTKDASMTCPGAAPDGYRCSLSINGGGGQAITAATILPVVGNSGSFSVSAWVKLSACAGTCVAVSEDASQTYGFALEFQHTCRSGGSTGSCWKFAMPVSDSSTATVNAAASAPGTAKPGTWTQLTGVFNASHSTMTLYVNGTQAGQASPASPWTGPASGKFRIGNRRPGGLAHDWSGRLSNACAFYGVLQPSDVLVLFHGDASHPNDGCAALFATYP